ncbi:MAG: 3-dehydroquinate synthase [Hahellaceae bacterium]|nr:3-dehydroquinate synthase [Hahellaceae bacterium]MCP5168836.1 3-dehydroquinate synthase [Hahellaceae bacterium]
MKELYVDLGERGYPIYIGQDLLARRDLVVSKIAGKQVMIVTNTTVGPLYLEKVKALFQGFDVDTVVLPDGEQYKNLDTLNLIFDALLAAKHSRKTTLVALGGGVIGDMTGFAAACYQRGVDFIQIPTTLLSQVDSSVGGKTGVNHARGKNMIGAFHQPKLVLIDTNTLNTLPQREISAGLAEVVKYGFIRSPAFLTWLNDEMGALRDLDPGALTHAIYTSCQCKASVVAEDEKEADVRAILNFGHTFGHAIETFMGYGNWLHGEAVGAGMAMALDLSMRHGWISLPEYEWSVDLIRKAGLPVFPPEEMTPEHFIELMSVDKKVLDGSLRLVLLMSLGFAEVTGKFNSDLLQQTLGKSDN